MKRAGPRPCPCSCSLTLPVLLRFPLHRRCFRVLHLEPIGRAPRTIARAQPLAYDALAAKLASVPKDDVTGFVEMFVQLKAKLDPVMQKFGERLLANFNRLTAKIYAVQLQQVEGVQEHGIVATDPQLLKNRNPIFITADRPAVDQAGAHRQRCRAYADQGVSVRPVVPVARDQTDPRRVAADHEPKAVMLDFVHPAWTGRRALGSGWQTGLNKRRHTHARVCKSPADVVNFPCAALLPGSSSRWS